MKYQSQFLSEFAERGYFYQCTSDTELDALANKQPITAYIGFDATADSLHVGSLMQIMTLRRLQKCGHKPIVLMGGGTSLVGDPSGKDESRKMLTEADIADNIKNIQKIFAQFLTFGTGKTDAVIVNNADWLKGLNYIDFLRDVGKHFSVNRMIGFESVKQRLDREQPLSFLEFNYMVLQAYDFMELKRQHNCDLQIGGADQWGNIVCGIDLARRIDSESLYGLTTPLLTTSSGAKMGKTASGAVWLNKDKLSVYDYWQFWRNTEDADVGKFLRLFTELPLAEINKLESLQGAEINEAKKILATEACALCHGRDEAEKASQAAADVFGDAGVSNDLPSITMSANDLSGAGLLEILQKLQFTASNSEGRRFVEQGAVKINDKTITDTKFKFSDEHIKHTPIKISLGKKKHGLIEIDVIDVKEIYSLSEIIEEILSSDEEGKLSEESIKEMLSLGERHSAAMAQRSAPLNKKIRDNILKSNFASNSNLNFKVSEALKSSKQDFSSEVISIFALLSEEGVSLDTIKEISLLDNWVDEDNKGRVFPKNDNGKASLPKNH